MLGLEEPATTWMPSSAAMTPSTSCAGTSTTSRSSTGGCRARKALMWSPGRASHDRPTALLMLTARDTPADRIRGLDAGADDYLVKPFDFGELLARIRALQRRPRAVDAPVLSRSPDARPGATRGGRRRDPIALTATEYRILELLMRRSPGVVDRRAIAEHAWRGRDGPARLQRHRRPDEPPAGEAARTRASGSSRFAVRATGWRRDDRTRGARDVRSHLDPRRAGRDRHRRGRLRVVAVAVLADRHAEPHRADR